MSSKSIIFYTLFSFFLPNFVSGVVFENVHVSLKSKFEKIHSSDKTQVKKVFIQSSDGLGEYINPYQSEVVFITGETIPKLKKNSVSDLSKTKYLRISSSKIEEIQPGTFSNVPKLRHVNLNDNSIEEIKNGVFTGLSLLSLSLNRNKISKIENAAFNNMTLANISLSDNRISKWSSDIFKGSPVRHIVLSMNLLEELPANTFDYLLPFKKENESLTVNFLGLQHNHLWRIHPEAFNHVQVFNYLDLSDNGLYELAEGIFGSVDHMGTLVLSSNPMDCHNKIFDGIEIRQLVLANNSLSCFPTGLFNVSKISFVYLQDNLLSCECRKIWKVLEERNDLTVYYGVESREGDCVGKNGKKV